MIASPPSLASVSSTTVPPGPDGRAAVTTGAGPLFWPAGTTCPAKLVRNPSGPKTEKAYFPAVGLASPDVSALGGRKHRERRAAGGQVVIRVDGEASADLAGVGQRGGDLAGRAVYGHIGVQHGGGVMSQQPLVRALQ